MKEPIGTSAAGADADEATAAEALREKLADALVPGFHAEFDPDEAAAAGAFAEDALSEEDAAESGLDPAGTAVSAGRKG